MKQSTAKATAFCADCGMCLDEAELLAKKIQTKLMRCIFIYTASSKLFAGLPKIEIAYIGTDCFY